MNLKKIYIVEDFGVTRATLISILKRSGYTIAGTALTAENAWLELKNSEVNLALIDINLKGTKDGLWLAEKLRKYTSIKIIILTAFGNQEVLDQIYRLQPEGYIMKPFNNPTLLSMIALALQARDQNNKQISANQETSIVLKCTHGLTRLNVSEICFFKSNNNYVEIHTENECLRSRNKLGAIEELIPINFFFRIHRRFLVNGQKIKILNSDRVMIGNQELPLSKTFDRDLLELFLRDM